jgi:hypothetical protein
MSRITLLKASLVAALLLPFSAAVAEATSIPTTSVTCGFGQNPSHCGGSNTDNVFVFDGGAYTVELNFVGGIPVQHPHAIGFDVTVTDSPLTDPLPPGTECLNLTGTPDGCRQFSITPGAGAQWNGNVDITIAWLFDTNTLYPNGTTDQVRMIHLHGGIITDVTVPGSYFSTPPAGCQNEHGHPNNPDPNPNNGCDPGMTGEIDSFSDVYVIHELSGEINPTATTVPEPATLVLFGSGLMAIAAARRRAGKR